MNPDAAMRLALRHFADPRCRRCGGAGATGDDPVATVCRCVRERAPRGDPGELPHPWGPIVKYAQRLHATDLLHLVPDVWS
ncbi:MAG TPA: hypothetical protein VNN12_05480 [Dehalococcoidia bacterium]|nr:hypothetical protein [Dehalococcoidia bacterium]